MTQSAIWKIENGQPRRRITLDEAVAFARVFKTDLHELLRPVHTVASEEARRLVEQVEAAEAELVGLIDRFIELFAQYLRLVTSENEVDEFALGHADAMLEATQFHDPSVQPVSAYRSLVPEHGDPIGEAFDAFLESLGRRAQEIVMRERKGEQR